MSKDSVAKNNIWKWLVLAVVAVASVYVTTPIKEKVRLGLDLRGGTSFTLGIDEEKLREMVIEEIISENPNASNLAALTNDVKLVQAKMAARTDNCDDRIIQVIRRRVDARGINEPVIQGMKGHRLLVQIPGTNEAERAEARTSMQSAAFLEFRLVHPRNDVLVSKLKDACPEGYVKGGAGFMRAPDFAEVSRKPGYAARLAAFGTTDPRYRFMLEEEREIASDGTVLSKSYRPCFVSRKVELTGDLLKSAAADRDSKTFGYRIDFEFTSEGGRRFSEVTRKNIGRQLAIVLDDALISAPVIRSEIGSRGEISGNFSLREAQLLAGELNAGALPAPLKVLAESSVMGTVGEDAIESAKWAAGIGFLMVALFMFFYYWYAGLVADVALFLDVVLLPTALVLVANVLGVFAHDPSMGGGGSTQLPVLTMPGIAGLVLSLGMAVDANVLIFERIREEFAAGRATGEAIKNGYGRAFTAIFDSNLTTIITGVILFVFGTGPVRGFAITLTAGVVISMFTAVVVTRLVFDHTVNGNSKKPFKMRCFFKNPKFNFMGFQKIAVGVSVSIIVLTIAIFAIRLVTSPSSVLAVDLTGGTSIVYSFNESAKPEVKDIRAALNDFDNAAVIQYQDGGVGKATLLVKTGETGETAKGSKLEGRNVGSYITKVLREKFPKAAFKAASVDEVGSVVGSDLKRSGTQAVIFSLIAILIYVGFRFKFGFGLGGIAALAHDALVSLGLFSLCGRQVSLIVITALLTIIGYSINDTVVVFDRIRERLNRDQKTSFGEICNQAINDCLSRTVITSVTTFFAVLALFAFGDGSIFDFALTMLIGIVAGTYSSVFIATPIMFWWYKGRRPDFEEERSERQG